MNDSEKLVRELVAMHNFQENPDFEEQVRDILENYIVFYKNRLPEQEYRKISQEIFGKQELNCRN